MKKIKEKDLEAWKKVQKFKKVLSGVLKSHIPHPSELDTRRKLQSDDYFSLILFAFFNPIIDSMRGLCAASELDKVQDEICTNKVSLGSFSEAQAVFEPELLRQVMLELSKEHNFKTANPELADAIGDLIAVDGSLFKALPRMTWALYRNDGKNNAVKLHLKYSVLRNNVVDAITTNGKTCERKTLKKMLKKGEYYTADRYYGLEYDFFQELKKHGCSFSIRIRNDAQYTVEKELQLTDDDKKAGVVWDGIVKLGSSSETVRLTKIKTFDDKEILIVSDREDLSAELISIIYLFRWQIELYFKWIKCIMKSRHLLAESPAGVAINIYCILIAAMLFFKMTGRKPSKRDMELIQFYEAGYASKEELIRGLKLNDK